MGTNKRLLFLLLLFCLGVASYGQETIERYRLSAVVSDMKTGRLLKKVPVKVLPYNREVKTDELGRFLLNMPAGKVTLLIDYGLYDKTECVVDLRSDTTLTLALTAPFNARVLEEVEVISARPVNERNAAVEGVDKRWLDQHPSMMGEKDLLKTLSLTSGVTPSREGAADLQVRGGTQGQNLFLLDGLPLYSTSHFFGMVSAYNPAAIRRADLYKAAFPARFGGKVASVLDVQTVDADLQRSKGEVEIGLLSSKAALHIPLVKNRLGLFVAGRLSNYTLINAVNLFSGNGYKFNLNFNDINANLLWKPTDKDVLKLTWFSNDDRFNVEQPDRNQLLIGRIENSQYNAGLSWQRQYDATHQLVSNLYADQYAFSFEGGVDNLTRTQYTGLNTTTNIRSLAANTTYSVRINPSINLSAGAALIRYTLLPVSKIYSDALSIPTTRQSHAGFSDIAVFGEGHFLLTKNHQLDAGLRLDDVVNANTHFVSLEPRLSYLGQLPNQYAVSASISKMTQPLHKVLNPGLGLPIELYVPSGSGFKPEQAWIYSAGISKELTWKHGAAGFKTDVWFKQLNNLVEFRDGYDAQRILLYQDDFSERTNEFLCQGKGTAFGMDVSGTISMNKLSLALDYTWMKASNQFDALNNGRSFAASSDIRHALSATLDYKVSPTVMLSANWQYRSGSPVTVPLSYVQLPGSDDLVWLAGERNNFRTQPFHKLDLNLSKNVLVFRRYQGSFSLGLYNVYNRANPYLYFMETRRANDGSVKPILKSLSAFPVLPTASFRVTF